MVQLNSPWALAVVDRYRDRINRGIKRNYGCVAYGLGTPYVDVTGQIYGCGWLVGDDAYVVGDAISASFDKEQLGEMQRKFDVSSDAVCGTCAYRYVCGGGCSITRVVADGFKHGSEEDFAVDYNRRIQCAETTASIDYLLKQSRSGASTVGAGPTAAQAL